MQNKEQVGGEVKRVRLTKFNPAQLEIDSQLDRDGSSQARPDRPVSWNILAAAPFGSRGHFVN